MLRFDKATYLSLLFKFILYVRLSNSLWGWDVTLFLEFMNIVSIMFYNFITALCLITIMFHYVFFYFLIMSQYFNAFSMNWFIFNIRFHSSIIIKNKNFFFSIVRLLLFFIVFIWSFDLLFWLLFNISFSSDRISSSIFLLSVNLFDHYLYY